MQVEIVKIYLAEIFNAGWVINMFYHYTFKPYILWTIIPAKQGQIIDMHAVLHKK